MRGHGGRWKRIKGRDDVIYTKALDESVGDLLTMFADVLKIGG